MGMQDMCKGVEHRTVSGALNHLQSHAHGCALLYLVYEVWRISLFIKHQTNVHSTEHCETRFDTQRIGLLSDQSTICHVDEWPEVFPAFSALSVVPCVWGNESKRCTIFLWETRTPTLSYHARDRCHSLWWCAPHWWHVLQWWNTSTHQTLQECWHTPATPTSAPSRLSSHSNDPMSESPSAYPIPVMELLWCPALPPLEGSCKVCIHCDFASGWFQLEWGILVSGQSFWDVASHFQLQSCQGSWPCSICMPPSVRSGQAAKTSWLASVPTTSDRNVFGHLHGVCMHSLHS